VLNERENQTNDAAQPPQSFFRRYRVVIFVVSAFAVVVLLILRHHKHQQELAAMDGPAGGGRGGASAFAGGGGGRGGRGAGGGPNSAVAVTVAEVTSGDIEVRIPALGTITPLATITVRPQVSGILTKVAFQEGQLVKAGQFLAEIDPRPYQAALEQAKGSLRKDQAQLADARLDLKRFEELIKEDSVAQQQLDTQRALVDQYGGQIESDQAAVRTAQINLEYTHIVSPVSGRVGLRQIDQGNYVTPGDTNGLVVVTELQPISAIFAIPEDNVNALMDQLHGGGTLNAEAFDRGNSTLIGTGQVKGVDSQIDTTTGTIKLRALFANEDGRLFPNQFVNIQLVVNVLHDQIVMPGSAVHRGAPNGVASTFVYLVNSTDNTVAVRPVTLGTIDGERVAVTKGLQAGDVVVTEGGDRLRDGASIILPANTTQHPTTAAPQQQHKRGSGKENGQYKNRGQQPPASQ
jgi:multidrug efflux system membrane fusion protein